MTKVFIIDRPVDIILHHFYEGSFKRQACIEINIVHHKIKQRI